MDAANSQGHDMAVAKQAVLSVLLRACTSAEPGLPAREARVKQLHGSGLLSMTSILDISALYASGSPAACQAVAQACWQTVDMTGVLIPGGRALTSGRCTVLQLQCSGQPSRLSAGLPVCGCLCHTSVTSSIHRSRMCYA